MTSYAYWPTRYWPDSYWPDFYWPDQAPAPSRRIGLPLFDREPDQARSDIDRHVRSRRQADTTQKIFNPLIRKGEIAATSPTDTTIVQTAAIIVSQQVFGGRPPYGMLGG